MSKLLPILLFISSVANSQVIADTVYASDGSGGYIKYVTYRNPTTTITTPPTRLRDSMIVMRQLVDGKQPIGNYLVAADISGKLNTNGDGSGLTGLTKSQVGLSNVINESKATMFISPAFTGTPTGIGLPVYARVTGSNAATTGQALVDITGLTAPLIANAVYEFEAVLSVSTSAVTTGTAYGVNYSAAGASIESQITGASTATASKTLRISAFNSATALYLATSGQTGGVIIKGTVTTGANAGNLTIQHLKLTSGTSTVFINSSLKVTRIN